MFIKLCILLVIHAFLAAHSAESDCQPDEKRTSLEFCPHVFNISMLAEKGQRTYNIDNWRDLRSQTICCPMPGNELPNTEICGQSEAVVRIMGGSEAAPNAYPWMAMLLYRNLSSREINSFCAGSLINNRYVLTAAHCVYNMPGELILKSVRLGEHDTTSNPDCTFHGARRFCAPPHMEIEVETIVVHEKFHMGGMSINQNDIALLRLRMPVRYSRGIRPICVRGPHNIRTNYGFRIAGWGKTETGRHSPVLLSGIIGKRNLDRCSEKSPDLNFDIYSQICAGGLDGNDTCVGDSGSPLMATMGQGLNEYVYLAGITSNGPPACGMIGWPAVYTKTSAFVEWIQNNIWP
ncbi:spaetzle-processing enzyme [Drosophila gunungcola]|uniref:spaetzle-processing enzyme n=1 Tax=Drosophila gunungcola TaxID=103775 RepID=UPI0022E86850|nr:spaetzle-processing enzyme [Drosophila gunungcola]